ncbi:MAG: nucleotidyl transferase AbiEii/AbiGii toxin family protein [Aquabacterium sp.]
MAVTDVDFDRPGIWQKLFPEALRLMAHLESQTDGPVWTFGGGTVLMLRINHRLSKDIDLFVSDPQYLGYVNPRLSDVAESVSVDYEENAEFIKFFLPDGEIDVVVGSSLTEAPFDIVRHAGRNIRVETCAEIIAKKMWHRGDRAKARDLFDLCAVAQAQPNEISRAAPFFQRHGAKFLSQLDARGEFLEAEFKAIDVIEAGLNFERCVRMANDIILPLIQK